jgi:formylglycine-generating enzyme required for sulfatase activity
MELTPELLSSVEPKLSTLQLAGQLELYDKLIYGGGDFVRIEGKSRRCLLLLLDKNGRYFARLYDLPESQLKEAVPKGVIHFTGVCSKIEATPRGTVQVTITYALLSSLPDRIYTMQAQAYVRRAEETKKRNQALLVGSSKASGAASPSSQSARSLSEAQQDHLKDSRTPPGTSSRKGDATASNPSGPGAQNASVNKGQAEPADDNEDSQEPGQGRPILIKRGPPPKEPSHSSTASPSSPAGPPSESMHIGEEQDNVIYRRSPAGSAPTNVAAERSAPQVNRSNVSLSPGLHSGPETEGMVLVPVGFVTMGSPDPGDSEKPVHRLQIQAFYLDKYEVTNLEYKQFCDATGHPVPPPWKDNIYPPGLEKHPVTQVTWRDALAYARWAGKRLPTEAEWERAAKGPHSTRYAYGNAYEPSKANTETHRPAPIGSYPATGFGACDMTGNVAEWTSSLYKPYPYKNADGREDPSVEGPRVVRGGHYSSGEHNSRCLVRTEEGPGQRQPTIGFRCARDAV